MSATLKEVEAGASPPHPSADGRRGALIAILGVALLAGMALRLWNLGEQVLGGDELHAVRAAVKFSPGEILTRYSRTDYPLPLTALYSLLLRSGAVLDEWAWRWPSLLSGAAAIVTLPWLLARRLGNRAVAILAALIALAPALVFYSRIARSYMPMVWLSALAVAAFAEWWERGSRRWGATYVVAGALAVWLHLGAAPAVASPFLWAAVDVMTRRRDPAGPRRRVPALLAMGGITLAAWALFLGPALPSLGAVLATKQGGGRVGLDTVWATLELQAGSPSGFVTVVFWLAALAGLLRLVRRLPRTAGLGLAVLGAQMTALVLLAPWGIGHPLVLSRYLLPAAPFVLLWVATLLAAPSSRAGAAAVLLLIAGWTASGPLGGAGFRRGTFSHHDAFVAFVLGTPRATSPAPLELYRRLPPGAVLEAPWHAAWDAGRSYPAYQLEHRRRVLVATSATQLPRHAGLRFTNTIALEPDAVLASSAAVLLLHRRLPAEESAIAGGVWRQVRWTPQMRDELRGQAERARAELVAAFGPPHDREGAILVWHLDRLRLRR